MAVPLPVNHVLIGVHQLVNVISMFRENVTNPEMFPGVPQGDRQTLMTVLIQIEHRLPLQLLPDAVFPPVPIEERENVISGVRTIMECIEIAITVWEEQEMVGQVEVYRCCMHVLNTLLEELIHDDLENFNPAA